ncbi:MAG: hypothetical protein VZS44_08645 [Bacilli bacterium]|nr:hypothetical protein [Bacilli bacterium]
MKEININCFSIKQVIVKTALLQLQNKVRKDYYIITKDHNVREWATIENFYRYVTDPHLIVFKDFNSFIVVETISEQSSNKAIRNHFRELSGSFFRITLSHN